MRGPPWYVRPSELNVVVFTVMVANDGPTQSHIKFPMNAGIRARACHVANGGGVKWSKGDAYEGEHIHTYVECLFELCIPHKLATFTFETQDVHVEIRVKKIDPSARGRRRRRTFDDDERSQLTTSRVLDKK